MTSPKTARCRFTSVTIVSILVLWPLAHMPLSRHYRINPWKLGGFGMFAAPGDLDGGVHVGVVTFQSTGGGAAPLPAFDASIAELFRFRGWNYQTFPARANNYTYGQLDFSAVVDGLTTPVDLDALSEKDRLRAIDLVTNVRLWHRSKYIADLAAHIEQVVLPRGQVDRVAVLVTSTNLQPLHQRVESETCVYVVRQGDVSNRGCFSAEALDRHRLEQVLSRTVSVAEHQAVGG
jgi:hypothetical protein